MSIIKTLIADIETFNERVKMTATGFGQHFMNSPRFLSGLREGRSPTGRTIDKLYGKMETYEQDVKERKHSPDSGKAGKRKPS